MESKHVLMSALGVGIGVGVGIGLASGNNWGNASGGVTPQAMEQEMFSLITNGRDSNVTFDQFPYYLRYFACLFFANTSIHFPTFPFYTQLCLPAS